MINTPLVSVDWLHQNIGASNLIILDASIRKVTATATTEVVLEKRIPATRFFDLKNKFSDNSGSFPNTYPSIKQFENEARALGINTNSAIVVYDDKGVYSSPRAWWLFKSFGFNNIAVLDGGLPEWNKKHYPVEDLKQLNNAKGDFKAQYQEGMVKFFEDILYESNNPNHLIIDARSEGRFNSKVPEPRAGLRSGKISNSRNLPFEQVLSGNCFKSHDELNQIFNTFANPNDNITLSCGSGITACVLALGAELAGFKNASVYDGSWTEWGTLTTE